LHDGGGNRVRGEEGDVLVKDVHIAERIGQERERKGESEKETDGERVRGGRREQGATGETVEEERKSMNQEEVGRGRGDDSMGDEERGEAKSNCTTVISAVMFVDFGGRDCRTGRARRRKADCQ